MVTLILLTNVICQVLAVACDFWLSAWSSDIKNHKQPASQYFYLGIYALFGAGQGMEYLVWSVSM